MSVGDNLVFDSRKSSVMIIDMVNDALKPSGVYTEKLGERYVDQEKLISSNKRLLEATRSAQVPVIYTRSVRKAAEPPYLKHFIPPVGQRTRTYGAECFIEGTWGNEIIDELKPLSSEHIINKKRRSAFLNTSLDLILRSMDITTLVITGIGTPGCVESTVRAAFDLDYYIVIPKECTSTTSGREEKDKALAHMGNHCAVISTVDQVISALGSPTSVPLLSLRAHGSRRAA